MQGTSQDMKKAKNMGCLPSILWAFLTVYIFFALMNITRAPENLKLAGNWPKVAGMCGLQNYLEKAYICNFQTKYPYYQGFYASFWAFRPIWLATSISVSSFWLVDTYFWSYFSWLAKSGCQNHKLAGNMFPPFPSFWSPEHYHVF